MQFTDVGSACPALSAVYSNIITNRFQVRGYPPISIAAFGVCCQQVYLRGSRPHTSGRAKLPLSRGRTHMTGLARSCHIAARREPRPPGSDKKQGRPLRPPPVIIRNLLMALGNSLQPDLNIGQGYLPCAVRQRIYRATRGEGITGLVGGAITGPGATGGCGWTRRRMPPLSGIRSSRLSTFVQVR